MPFLVHYGYMKPPIWSVSGTAAGACNEAVVAAAAAAAAGVVSAVVGAVSRSMPQSESIGCSESWSKSGMGTSIA